MDNAISFRKMFEKCSNLILISNTSQWNTSNVTDMSNMFSECSSLMSLPDISNWNTYNVINMNKMFYLIYQIGILTMSLI